MKMGSLLQSNLWKTLPNSDLGILKFKILIQRTKFQKNNLIVVNSILGDFWNRRI